MGALRDAGQRWTSSARTETSGSAAMKVAFTSLGDLCLSVKHAIKPVTLMSLASLESIGALTPTMERLAEARCSMEVETKLLSVFYPETQAEVEKLREGVPPGVRSRFKTRAEGRPEVERTARENHVSRFPTPELVLGASNLRCAEQNLNGEFPEHIAPSVKTLLRYSVKGQTLVAAEDEEGIDLDSVPVAVLGCTQDRAAPAGAPVSGVCTTYSDAISPVTHVFAKDSDLARSVLLAAGASGLVVGGINELRQLRAALDSFRGQPFTCVNPGMVDFVLSEHYCKM